MTYNFPTFIQTNKGECIYIYYKHNSPLNTTYAAPFLVNGDWFYTAEQYYLHQKAQYFGQWDIAAQILSILKVNEQRKLIYNMKKWDHEEWMEVSDEVDGLTSPS